MIKLQSTHPRENRIVRKQAIKGAVPKHSHRCTEEEAQSKTFSKTRTPRRRWKVTQMQLSKREYSNKEGSACPNDWLCMPTAFRPPLVDPAVVRCRGEDSIASVDVYTLPTTHLLLFSFHLHSFYGAHPFRLLDARVVVIFSVTQNRCSRSHSPLLPKTMQRKKY